MRVNVPEPLLPETVPPQVVLPSPDRVMPEGRLSASEAVRAAAVLLVLLRVRMRVEVPPAVMVDGLKDLLSDGATMGVTVRVATAGEALLPSDVLRAPAVMELK